jgi:hypothetical protein
VIEGGVDAEGAMVADEGVVKASGRRTTMQKSHPQVSLLRLSQTRVDRFLVLVIVNLRMAEKRATRRQKNAGFVRPLWYTPPSRLATTELAIFVPSGLEHCIRQRIAHTAGCVYLLRPGYLGLALTS